MNGLLSILFFITMGSSIINPLVEPLIFSPQGFFPYADPSQRIHAYSLLMGAYALGMIVGNPTWGIIADTLGRRYALMLALAGTLCCYLFGITSLIAVSFSLFVASRFLDGVMSGRRAITLSMLVQHAADKIRLFQLSEMANAAGLFLGPVSSGLLVHFFSASAPLYYYSLPFIVLFIAVFFNFLWVGFFLEDASSRTTETVINTPLGGLWLIYGRFFIFQLGWYLYFLTITPYIILHWQFSAVAVGIFFSALIILYILVLYLLSWLKKKIAMHTLASGSLYLLIAALAMMSFWDVFLVFLVCNALIAFTAACSLPVFMAQISDQKQDHEQGTVLGIQSAVIGLAWLCGTLLLGYFAFIPLRFIFLGAAMILTLLPLLSYRHA